MTEPDPRIRLLDLTAAGLHEFAAHIGCGVDRWNGVELSDTECAPFLRAIDHDLIRIDGRTCEIHGIGLPTTRPKRYQLFSSYDGGAKRPGPVLNWSWQEMFTQVGFAAELILDHGWPAQSVELEVGNLDIAAGEPDTVRTAPALLAEAKIYDHGSRGLEAMMAVVAELNGTGPPARVPGDARTNAQRKYECILQLRPRCFVEVAPGVRRPHDVHYDSDAAFFTPRQQVIRGDG